MYLQTRNKFINIQVELNDILERIVNEKLHSRPINDFFFFFWKMYSNKFLFSACVSIRVNICFMRRKLLNKYFLSSYCLSFYPKRQTEILIIEIIGYHNCHLVCRRKRYMVARLKLFFRFFFEYCRKI